MSLNVSGNTKIAVGWSEALAGGLNSGTFAGSIAHNLTFANGTGAGAMNEVWSHSATLAISTPVTLTLSALTDDLGRSIAFAKGRLLAIINNGTATLTVGAAAANPVGAIFGDAATDKLKIAPGGAVIFTAPGAAGLAFGAGASDQLKLDPGATACPYQIVLFGE